MAHKTATASKATQKGNVAGKRLGVKLSHGQGVKTGQIIVRQRGRTFIAGENVRMGKDFTLYAVSNGKVCFGSYLGRRKRVSVTA
ncbi:MAG: 50S ribosomal protein L27 [Patescibacteria group bacterium]